MHGKTLGEKALAGSDEAETELREPEAQADAIDRQYSNLKDIARQNFDFDSLLHEYAIARLEADTYKRLVYECMKEVEQIRDLVQEKLSSSSLENAQLLKKLRGYVKSRQEALNKMFLSGVKAMENKASKRGMKAADIRHSKPGESRHKQEAIRAAWATGKYSSRDVCAEQECAALNMAPGTARRALRNTPEPPIRCAA